jgi:nicotinate-nucleotide pyrophosphorylase (carboxylating)
MTETKSSTELLIRSPLSLREQITDALAKDSGEFGDVTSLALIEKEHLATAELVVKANHGVISGIEIAKLVFEIVDPEIIFNPLLKDGDAVKKGDLVARIEGRGRSILTAERIALEFMRRMSGIATNTQHFVHEVEGTGVIILDTRKILPGYGELDKQAVRDGSGTNHRSNLSEMGLIKNNHIDILGGHIALAISTFREKYPNIPLEVEVRNEEELVEALISLPDRIMLDNMDNIQTLSAVNLRNEFAKQTGIKIPLEASGNMTLERVKSVASTGVDYISVGSLTHSVEAFDLSLHISFKK